MVILSLQSLLSSLFSALISDIFVMCVSWFFSSTQNFLLRSEIDIESKVSRVGGEVQSEFLMLLVQSQSRSALLGSPGGGTGDFLFLPFYVIAKLPLVLGGWLCIWVWGWRKYLLHFQFRLEQRFIHHPPPTPPDWLFVAPHLSALTWVLKYIFTWRWVGIKGGLVSKLGMKEALNFHFILDPSVKKYCKASSVDIGKILMDVPGLHLSW